MGWGSKFFPFKIDSFIEGTCCAGKHAEPTKHISLVKHGGNLPGAFAKSDQGLYCPLPKLLDSQ